MGVVIKKAAKAICSLRDVFEFLEKVKPGPEEVNLYRGHAIKDKFKLTPSLFRKRGHTRHEKNILRELIAIQPNEFRDDVTTFERLVRMQHYRLPTRLLDLTYNPLVGLYFACIEKPKDHAELLCFSVQSSSIKYFDSDTISCIANLSNLTSTERNRIRRMTNAYETLPSGDGPQGRLLHFIKAEKP